jgi:hypothetical protein
MMRAHHRRDDDGLTPPIPSLGELLRRKLGKPYNPDSDLARALRAKLGEAETTAEQITARCIRRAQELRP